MREDTRREEQLREDSTVKLLKYAVIGIVFIIIGFLIGRMNNLDTNLQNQELVDIMNAEEAYDLWTFSNEKMYDQFQYYVDDIDETSIILISDSGVLDVIARTEEDYDNVYYMMTDRTERLFSTTQALESATKELQTIYFIGEEEIIDETVIFEDPDSYITEFWESERAQEIMDAKSRAVFYFEDGKGYMYRAVRNMYAANSRQIMCIEVDLDFFLQGYEGLEDQVVMGWIDESGYHGDIHINSDLTDAEINEMILASDPIMVEDDQVIMTELRVDGERFVLSQKIVPLD